jgi:hypothetical protein
MVYSPMAILNQQMKIRTVTYTQDSRGTLTSLDLVAPWALGDKAPPGPNVTNPIPTTQNPVTPQSQPQQEHQPPARRSFRR